MYIKNGLNNNFDLFDGISDFMSSFSNKTFMASDLCENDKAYMLTCDVPGVKKENINISFDNRTLIVTVNQEEDTENKKNYIRKENYSAQYSRSYYLADGDSNSIKAKLENGVLRVIVGKINRVESKQTIAIE
jgi:HSP20 family protein